MLALPGCWVAGELLRSTQPWGGFGWFLLGHTQGIFNRDLRAPVAELARYAGVPLLSFFLASVSCVVVAPMHRTVMWNRWTLIALVAIAMNLALLTRGKTVDPDALFTDAARNTRNLPVAALQTNNPHSNRVAPTIETLSAEFRVLAGLHRDAAESEPRPALILWPETMLPGPFNRDADGLDQSGFATAARALVEECGIPTVVGGSYVDDTLGRRHNSAYLLIPGESGREPRHDKIHRVPFGEYIPGPAWLKELVLNRFSPYDFDYTLTEGVLGEPFELPLPGGRTLRFATPICFEDTDPKLTRQMADGGAEALLNLTTSGWFGRMPAADGDPGGLAWRSVRAQHLQIAGFRSIETGLPTLRAVNTGDSALITGAGFVRAALPSGEPGILRAELPLPAAGGNHRTLYLRGGYLFAPANAVLATVFLAIGLFRRRKQKEPQMNAEERRSAPARAEAASSEGTAANG